MTSEWVWKTLGSSRESGRFQSLGPGCASLSNMAIRSVMVNLMSVTVENLQGVPWQVGKKLWERIRKWYVLGCIDVEYFVVLFACISQFPLLQPETGLGEGEGEGGPGTKNGFFSF